MDPNSTYTEMDSFAVELLKTVQVHKENFEKVTKEDLISQPSSVNNANADCEEEKVVEKFNNGRPKLNDRLRQFALKYKEQDDVDNPTKDYSNHLENVNVEKDVNTESINDCQSSSTNNNIYIEPVTIERPKLKDRLREFALKFNVENEEELAKQVEKTKNIASTTNKFFVNESKESEKTVPAKLLAFQSKSNCTKPEEQEHLKSNEKVLDVFAKETVVSQKISVSDLKKLFEKKIPAENQIVKAPELMSVREKAKLFELKRLEEEKARQKQYHPVHSRQLNDKRAYSPPKKVLENTVKRSKCGENIPDGLPNQTNEYEETLDPTDMTDLTENVEQGKLSVPLSEDHILNEEDHMLNEEDKLAEEDNQFDLKENEDEDDSNGKDEFDEQVAMECVDKAFETITNIYETQMDADLTFTALDNDESASKQFMTSLSADKLYPFLADEDEDSGHFQRTSTRSDVSNSVGSGLEMTTGESDGTTFDNQPCMPESQDQVLDLPQIKTLSFYRRQQQIEKANKNCPTDQDNQVLYLRQNLLKEELNYDSFIETCNEKLNKQYQRITNAKQIIKQASQALSLCLSLPDMIHSDARVEADRLLLESEFNLTLASSEIRRLKCMIEKPEKYYKKNLTKAGLSISNINLPLRHDFVVSRSKGKTQSVHHFSCFISYKSKMLCSKTVSTESNMSSDSLEFPFGLVINELEADFKVEIKLFDLELFKDEKPKKRGLNLAKSLRLKPSTASNSSGKSSNTIPVSPAPSSLSHSRINFKEVAALSLTLGEVRKLPKYFTFTTMASPLQGIMTMQLALEVNHQNYFEGFFDYQDIESRFWNLRWFVIDGPLLMYWRFKEDFATKKQPIGQINLKHCINPTVGFIKSEFRHLCTRQNTIMLVTIQPENVPNTTKLVTGGVIRKPKPQLHFISSASREEILELCDNLNDILNSLRAWETGRVVPKYSSEEFDRLMSTL